MISDKAKIKSLFVEAYAKAYEGCSLEKIAIYGKEKITIILLKNLSKMEKNQIPERRQTYSISVARYCDHPVGFLSCELNPKSGRIYLRWITVSLQCQHQGIGQKMLNAMVKHFPR